MCKDWDTCGSSNIFMLDICTVEESMSRLAKFDDFAWTVTLDQAQRSLFFKTS